MQIKNRKRRNLKQHPKENTTSQPTAFCRKSNSATAKAKIIQTFA